MDYFLYIKPLLTPKECGDTGIILDFEDTLFISIMDVLGHGAEAYKVAVKATTFLRNSFQRNMITLTNELHKHLIGTRGLVGNLLFLTKETGIVSYVGIGNVSTISFGKSYTRMVNQDCIIGYNLRNPKEQTFTLNKGDLLVMHSDGIKSIYNIKDNTDLLSGNCEQIATGVVQKLGKPNDDKACFVLKYN
jgi:hypothetical protein